MRPRAAMPVLKRLVPAINSLAPPPVKMFVPVSPSKPWSRWSLSEPMPQTITLFVPSVEVTKGEPRPFSDTVHTFVMVGVTGTDTQGVEIIGVGKNNISALRGSIGGRRLNDGTAGHMHFRQRRADPAQVGAVEQIGI